MRVYFAIHLHDQPRCMTIEVHNVSSDDVLTPESQTIEPVTAHMLPKTTLGWGHIPPKQASQLALLRRDAPPPDRLNIIVHQTIRPYRRTLTPGPSPRGRGEPEEHLALGKPLALWERGWGEGSPP